MYGALIAWTVAGLLQPRLPGMPGWVVPSSGPARGLHTCGFAELSPADGGGVTYSRCATRHGWHH